MSRSAALKNLRIFAVGASVCLISTIARAEVSADTAKMIARCETCHGPRGDSAFSSTPRLNGQQAAYLASRFRSFGDPTRQDPHATNNMWPMASQVTDATMATIAKYFSGQPPTPARSSGPLAAAGRKIYEQGAKGVPACQSCHGEHAEGKGAVPQTGGPTWGIFDHADVVLQFHAARQRHHAPQRKVHDRRANPVAGLVSGGRLKIGALSLNRSRMAGVLARQILIKRRADHAGG